MARKGENIYLRKDGRWEGRYIKGRKADGKPIFSSIYGSKYSEIKTALVVLKAQYSKKQNHLAVFGSGTLDDWARYYFNVLTKPYVKQTTFALYERNYYKHISPILGKSTITSIRKEDIQRFADRLKADLSASTLHGVMRLLKSVLLSAADKNVISKSPYVGIRLPKAAVKAPRVLSVNEQQRLERAAVEESSVEYILCLYTGLRVGELCALRWRDVDFESHSITVEHSIKRVNAGGSKKTALVMGDTKTESSVREIPVPVFVMKLLKDRFNASGSAISDYIFGKNGKCAEPRSVQKRFEALCDRLGIKRAHMHTLRHTYATRCFEKHIGYEVVCELLGHSSPKITLARYAHCTPETKRQSVAMLARIAV